MRLFARGFICSAICAALVGGTVLAGELAPEKVLVGGYSDVCAADELYGAVSYVSESGIMSGVDEGIFAPAAKADRATLAVVLWRLAGEPVVNYAMRFSDVPQEAWYGEAVRWAASSGIVRGYDDAAFAPHDVLTREQLCTMLYRYEQYMGGGFSGAWMFLLGYPDAAEISEWAYEAVCWMSMHQVTAPTDVPLVPRGSVTRGELAQVLAAYMQIAGR